MYSIQHDCITAPMLIRMLSVEAISRNSTERSGDGMAFHWDSRNASASDRRVTMITHLTDLQSTKFEFWLQLNQY